MRSFVEFLPCYEYEVRPKSGRNGKTDAEHSFQATADDSDDDAECVICMNEYVAGDPIRLLPCMHSFHKNCVDCWLRKSFTCPSCAEPVDLCILASIMG